MTALKLAAAAASALAITAGAAMAQTTSLRIQTHFSPETLSGQMAATFIERGINIVSGGTENHLMLVDLIGKPYTGKDADAALGDANITVNKNAVPNDPRSPFITSGLRVGTPAITTRGFGEAETIELTNWMCDVLESLENGTSEQVIAEVKDKVLDICGRFPVYG